MSVSVRSALVRNRGRLETVRGAVALLCLLTASACNRPSTVGKPAGRGLDDPVAVLNQQIGGGTRSLPFHDERGYLDAVLRALDVPVASQVLVYSQTSRQREQIGPSSPRAIYFNDTTAVGWVPGADELELVTFSPVQHSTTFYTLQQRRGVSRFERGERCFECHTIEGRGGMQGWLVRSIVPGGTSTVTSQLVDDSTPLPTRWGGWFVTGGPPGVHLGTPLSGLPSSYLTARSDIGALMVLGHQASITNLIAAVHREAALLERENSDTDQGQRAMELDARIEALVNGLLFLDEAPIPTPLQAGPEFVEAFSDAHPRRRGRLSLRDLDLTRRLQRVRCSYMIESMPFRSLPDDVRRRVYRQMKTVLDLPTSGISPPDRRDVLAFLDEHLAEGGM